jgi:NHLM bacteriocin system ABC transporter peptidase/ATP-binding protein
MADIFEGKRKQRLRKVTTVLQMEAAECGSACLGMILGYFRRFVPPEELRVECGVSRDGSKASNVLKAARKYGLVAKGYKKEPQNLKTMRGPMIIHWNFNHFVVLEGFRGKRAFINDPAYGRRVVSEEEFDQSFTGVVLVFARDEGFKRGGQKRGILSSLKPRLKGAVGGVSFVFLAGLALVIPGLVIPVFSKVFVDNILLKGMKNWLSILLIAMAGTAIIRGFLVWLQEYFLLKLETKLALSGSSGFFWHVLRLPIEFFTQRYAGEIGNRVAINDSVASLIAGRLASSVLDLVLIIFYGALLIYYDLILTAAGVAIAVINLLFLRVTSNLIKDQNMRLLQDRGKIVGIAMGGLQLIETLKASGKESEFFTRWAGHQAKLMNSEQRMGETSNYLSAVPAFLATLNTAVILIVGGFRVLDGFITLGTLVAFQALMGSFLGPIERLVNLGAMLQQAKGELNRLDDVLNYKPDEYTSKAIDKVEETENSKLEGALEIRDLSFGYNRMDAPLIESFDLSVRPGARVALVGASGSGKSTVAKLIAGLYEPWSGEILFDGKPRAEIPRSVITDSLAMVDQDIALFDGTVKENLTLWDTTVPDPDVVLAAKHAEIHEDISARTGGYEHMLEENGRNFSGGQRQRLEIARAMAKNPRILILDEATSALDPKTEQMVDENIRMRGCTCIVVAHRLSTIRDCDEIIVMDRGKIVERGTHEELLKASGLYADLIRTQ